MNRFRAAFGIVAMFVVSGLLTGFAVAQSRSGTILGSVTDQSGAAIPGAKVLITNQGTNILQAVTTDSSGRYEALLLPVGTYTVTVSAAGLKESVLRNVILETQQSRELNFALVPGTVQQTVTVDETAVQVERTDPTLGQVIHSQQVSELPLNGRDFVQLATLAPGVTQGETGFFTNTSAPLMVADQIRK